MFACRPSRENLSRAGRDKYYVIQVIDGRIWAKKGRKGLCFFFTQSAVASTERERKMVIGDLPKRPPWLETYQLTAAWTCRPLLFTPKTSPTITVSHACKRECMRPPVRGMKVL